MRDKLIYVSGRYSGTEEEIRRNVNLAREVSKDIWHLGYTAICPHLNTAFFERDTNLTYDEIIKGDLTILKRCDAIYMMNGWVASKGAGIERLFAIENDIPVFLNIPEMVNYFLFKEYNE